MNVTAIRGLPDVRVTLDPARLGLWVQAGDNPEARRFVPAHELVAVGDALAFPEDVQQWCRIAIAYQRGLVASPVEPSAE